MGLKPCSQCKEMIADDAKTCPKCGTQIMSPEKAILVIGCFVIGIFCVIVFLFILLFGK